MHLLRATGSVQGRLITFGEPAAGSSFRPIRVWLPPGYGLSAKRYPVVYGQDEGGLLWPSGPESWDAAARLEALAWQGLETIVVDVGVDPRLLVRSIAPAADGGPGGAAGERYVAFLTRWLKPRVDASFRTLPEPEHSAVLGASLGGLVSLYALARGPEAFGRAAALSPPVHLAHGEAWRFVDSLERRGARVYVDAGTAELGRLRGMPSPASHRFLGGVRRLRERLEGRGFRAGRELGYLESPGDGHRAESWGRRLPGALAFLLA